jgi:hypothetical protein
MKFIVLNSAIGPLIAIMEENWERLEEFSASDEASEKTSTNGKAKAHT